MYKNNAITRYLLMIVLLMLSCSNIHYSQTQTSNVYENQIIKASYAFSFLTITATATMYCPDSNVICAQSLMKATASGVIVSKNSNSKTAYILTANHFCDNHVKENKIVKHTAFGDVKLTLTTKLDLVDKNGINFKDANIFKTNPTNDLCVISATYNSDNIITPIEIAKSEPTQYTKIFNIAAPKGKFIPGSPLAFDGLYVGYNKLKNMLTITLTVMPGSSGSMVLDGKGHLFAIILERTIGIDTVGYASPLVNIKNIIADIL